MRIFRRQLCQKIEELNKKGVRVLTIGDLSKFPKDIQKRVKEGVEKTKNNKGITVIFALNYGGRAEITYAVNTFLKEGKTTISEEDISSALQTPYSDIDLLIRTSGEERISNFLLWQLSYAEFYFSQTLWPDFKAEELDEIIEEVVAFRRDPGFVVGFDVAGEEDWSNLSDLERVFRPAFEACVPVTIHAGEGATVKGIWNAAYRLHADRIGHGLTLPDDPALMARFRDRGIAVEMCPTSNVEVVGYGPPDYPLKALWAAGLHVTINTDNPAFGRTNPAREFVEASRLCGGLSLWDALAILKQGFAHAFIPAEEREAMLKEVDRVIFEETRKLLAGYQGRGGLHAG